MFPHVPRHALLGLALSLCAFAATGLIAPSYSAKDEKPGKGPRKTMTVDVGVTMEFVLIDPKANPDKGKFKMGSPQDEKDRNRLERRFDAEKQHDVEITRPYYLAKYPVTQEQYAALIGKNPSTFQPGARGADSVKGLDTSQFPVERVSWDDAQGFCKTLAEKDSKKRKFRLPTEAEWEYACRAGTTTPFSFGSELNGKQANCDGTFPYGTEAKGPFKSRTTKVGEYGENPWGLCDMHGNVWQWCEDYYGPYDLPVKDPLRSANPFSEERRVIRGGSWLHLGLGCRAAHREGLAPTLFSFCHGFRVAVNLD
jgi:formylglycine-generating enzyme required for sulfatase activity